jgi:hypothetical protein
MENQPMLDLLWRVRFRWKLHPRHVTGDTKYGTIQHIKAIEGQGIRAYVPLPDWEHQRPYFGPAQFTYDAEHDRYICPNGQLLHLSRMEYTGQKAEYRADATTCNGCPLKAQCTPSDQGRPVHRSFHASYLERVKAYHQPPAYQKAINKRKVWVEPLFAEAKDWHAPLPLANALARQLRSRADRSWSKSQTPAQKARLGTPPVPNRSPLCFFLGPVAWYAYPHVGEGVGSGVNWFSFLNTEDARHLSLLMSFAKEFFLRKWFGTNTAKKIDGPLDSRQSQEPMTSVEAMMLN